MNGPDHLRAKQVRQIRWHSRKTAAVHAQNHAKRTDKQHDGTGTRTAWHAGIHQTAQHKKHDISHLAAQLVRQAGPEEATTNIEQAEQRGKTSCNCSNGSQLTLVQFTKLFGHANQRAAKDLLQHGRGHANHPNTG